MNILADGSRGGYLIGKAEGDSEIGLGSSLVPNAFFFHATTPAGFVSRPIVVSKRQQDIIVHVRISYHRW